MTEAMKNPRPNSDVQRDKEQYAEQVWSEMEAIMVDRESRGTAAASVISPCFARFQDGLKKFCMMMSDLTDRGTPVAIFGYALPVDMDFRTGFWDQGRAMACLSWAVKSIKGLEAYKLTL